MSETIKLRPAGCFAGDGQSARRIRTSKLRPALESGGTVTLDFGSVDYATHSYVRALIGEALAAHGEAVLERIEFKDCSPAVRSAVEFVVGNALDTG